MKCISSCHIVDIKNSGFVRRLRFFISFSLLLSTSSSAVGQPCSVKGSYRVCELDENIPQAPLDDGLLVDRNFSGPSGRFYPSRRTKQAQETTEVRQAKEPSSSFTADIIGNPTLAQSRAVEFCMKIAGDNWVSEIPVTVRVNFSDFGQTTLLGTAQPSRNWLVNEYICPVALAEAVVKEDLNKDYVGNSKYDILMTLNSGASWYEGTDAKPPPGKFDLVTVCLHETYHGLFMSGGNIGVSVDDTGSYSAIFIRESLSGRFDSFMANQDSCGIAGYDANASSLGTVLTGNNLWFASETKQVARLHAPRPFKAGSSLYHLSEWEYGAGEDGNDLMTPAISSNYAQHNIGPVLLEMQALLLDVKGKSGARACQDIRAPEVDDSQIDQGAGGNEENPARTGGNSSGGFKVQLGDVEVSGWVFVGAGVGGLVCVVLVGLVIRGLVIDSRRKQERSKAQPKRRMAEEHVDFVNGGNAGGIV